MKIFPKFGNGYAEVDTPSDISEYIGLKIMSLVITCLVWVAGFMVGAFAIYYLLAHFDRILEFLANICDNLIYE